MDRGRAAAALALTVALLLAQAGLASSPLTSPAAAALRFDHLDVQFEEEDGSPANRAGSHPFAWRTTVLFDRAGAEEGGLRDLQIRLPPGLVGMPGRLPRCEHVDFVLQSCADATAVGVLSFLTKASLVGDPVPVLSQAPLYNLDPVFGSGAELGAYPEVVNKTLPLTIQVGVSPAPPNPLTASLADVSQVVPIFGYQLILWGDPADPAHDPYRGTCGADFELGSESFEPLSLGSCPLTEDPGVPFLTLPPSCGPAGAEFEATEWWPSSQPIRALLPAVLEPVGCADLPFDPDLSLRPTTSVANAPSGLDVSLEMPNEGLTAPTGTAAAAPASASLHLPEGMALNPAVATGLRVCTAAELARESAATPPGEGCPQAAAIGSATITTPLFAKPIQGTVYVAQPDDPATVAPGAENPFDSLLALYLVLRDPERGVLLGLPIRIEADRRDGRLSARIPSVPELPLSGLSLRFNSGPRAPLTTPGCGSHAIHYSLAPSSGNQPVEGEASFATASGCNVGFAPRLSAGTVSYAAGTAVPLVLELDNLAGAPNLSRLRLALPAGLAADLTASCPEAGVATVACPPDSRVGFARIALGAGPEPVWVPGGREPDSAVYLAGAYRGAPFSLLVSVPGTAGPFDLGRVVLRAPVRIDPHSGQASVEFADLPQILKGVPLQYRAIRLVIDRAGFIRTPTSCDRKRIELDATAEDGAIAAASSPFQAADCGVLPFRPRLAARLSGGLRRNGHPRVELRLASHPGEANLRAARFDLPAGELLDSGHIRALCDRRLSPGDCPAASRLGRVTLRSPLLPDPLQGPVYLRAPSRRYPDLFAELRAGGVRLFLHGRTGSAGGGRIRVHLTGLPDLPLSSATITLAGGRRGIVVNSAALCGRLLHASARLEGQNGKERLLRPRIHIDGRCR